MAIPLLQKFHVGSYVVRQHLAGRKRYPLVLMLEPLFRCNLECIGCGKIQYPEETLRKMLTPEQCFSASDQCGAPVVAIAGGEPLLHKEMPEIVEGILAKGKIVEQQRLVPSPVVARVRGVGPSGMAVSPDGRRLYVAELGINAIAVLDAVGVDPQSGEHGLGQSLMEGLVDLSKQRGVRSLQSHVSWTSADLLRFFNASNFKLAPRLDLERLVTDLREDVGEEP